MATFIMNEKRDYLLSIEKRHGVQVVIVPNPYMHSPQYTITRVKEDHTGKQKKISYSLIQAPEPVIIRSEQGAGLQSEPAVKGFDTTHEMARKSTATHLLRRLWRRVFGSARTTATSSHQVNQTITPDKPVHGAQRDQHITTGHLPRNNPRRRRGGSQNNQQRNPASRKPATASSGSGNVPAGNAQGHAQQNQPARRTHPPRGNTTAQARHNTNTVSNPGNEAEKKGGQHQPTSNQGNASNHTKESSEKTE